MAKKIMIQGTMSNAGKSLICAGLCRIFAQDGYKVAPFKSQNMALNSYITEEGLEMGRAQVVQAEAAGISPSVAMNPVLLKPTNDVGSQVIVNGKVLGNMKARDYFSYKKKLIPDILEAFHKLEETFDIIVIEGAGSPAEINLKNDDIVNMGLAKLVDAPVLLVGDIDRGGVFAQLLGTMMLLEEEEKQRVKGLIINKFRGDKTILDPGIDMLEERAKVPVVGVAPYMQVEIEDEDSLTERFNRTSEDGWVDVVVIRLPRISNFTDFQVLENTKGINLRYVSKARDLKNPDMIILPGTKNTIADLIWMRQNGLEAAILKKVAAGTIIWGICGGYQMLGQKLIDSQAVESVDGLMIAGLGLLPIETTFAGEKRRTRVTGKFLEMEGDLAELEGVEFLGYEIHMGETVCCTREQNNHEKSNVNESSKENEVLEFFDHFDSETECEFSNDSDSEMECELSNQHSCPVAIMTDAISGKTSLDGENRGNVYGTYVHGIFDSEEVNQRLISLLTKKKGLDPSIIYEESGLDYQAFKESQYDLLAEELRKHLDMNAIYKILG